MENTSFLCSCNLFSLKLTAALRLTEQENEISFGKMTHNRRGSSIIMCFILFLTVLQNRGQKCSSLIFNSFTFYKVRINNLSFQFLGKSRLVLMRLFSEMILRSRIIHVKFDIKNHCIFSQRKYLIFVFIMLKSFHFIYSKTFENKIATLSEKKKKSFNWRAFSFSIHGNIPETMLCIAFSY